MNFEKVIKALSFEFRKANVDYALIGGLALRFAGAERMTHDIDFIVSLSDSDKVHHIMKNLGYEALYKTQNVANYSGLSEMGQVDFLFAQRKYGVEMLRNAKAFDVMGETVKVVSPEHIIGLKVQSSANDSTRAEQDMLDVKNILLANTGKLDMAMVREYFKLFGKESELDKLIATL